MIDLRKGAAALLAAAAISAGGLQVASAAPAPGHAPAHTPCAQQQAHLDKAQAKLEWLTARFAAKSAKVRKDKRAVAATTGSAKARAKKALAADRSAKARIAKAKKAQVQRVAHATTALERCQAAHPGA
jgi:hypothetical protein